MYVLNLKPFVLITALLICGGAAAPATHMMGRIVCGDCHYAHEGAGGTNAGLLLAPAAGNEVCLSCHDDREGDRSGAPTVFSINGADPTYYPGGDFAGAGARGENGHFRVSGKKLVPDDFPATSPGGGAAINSADLACWSCHDPHNGPDSANAFRLLRLRPMNATTGAAYVDRDIRVNAEPAAFEDESGNNHTVYHSGVSEWCGACHSNPNDEGAGFHGSSTDDADVGEGGLWRRHPTDNTFPPEYMAEYKAADDSVTSDWEIPFEDTGRDWATGSATHDPTANDRVMCLSCHRAHVGRSPGGAPATYNADGLRWDPVAAMGHDSGCNKCHDK